ncbi:MAG: hypothetical protein Q8S33_12850 [Myxococcales bacterium]|nr:hypothetical protein [Myxococcales bacterium]
MRWWAVVFLSMVACETRLNVADAPPCSACTGCCDFGRCVPLALQNSSFCGTTGPCQTCSGRCVDGFCKPPSTCGDCAGCCSGSFCVAGNSDVACGTRGDSCLACPIEARCVAGACVACSPATCNGCCFGGTCRSGTEPVLCGRGGAACRACNTCIGGVCQ